MKHILNLLTLAILFTLSINYAFAQTYCTPSSGDGTSNFIKRVVIEGIDNNTGADLTSSGYSDFSAMVAQFEGSLGTSISVRSNDDNLFTTHHFSFWVDWNQDGDFDDTDEFLGTDSPGNSAGRMSIYYPSAAAGNYRLRIRFFLGTMTGIDDACGAYSDVGETEDYTLEVIAPPVYCTSSATNPSDSRIDQVVFGAQTINSSSLSCQQYTDNSSRIFTVTQNESYTLAFTTGTCGADQPQQSFVYIDWNRDGDFDDFRESVFQTGTYTGGNTFNATINVPAYANTVGTLGLRIITREIESTPISPCGTYAKGETEDYSVRVNAQSILANTLGRAIDYGTGCYQLTENSGNQFGAIWFKNKLDLNRSFDIRATMNFGSNFFWLANPATDSPEILGGADGIAFVIQNQSTTAGGTGGGIGYGDSNGALGISPSIAVEFDTYYNHGDDALYDHVGIGVNGFISHYSSGTAGPYGNFELNPSDSAGRTNGRGGFNVTDLNVPAVGTDPSDQSQSLQDGNDHEVRFTWSASGKSLKIYLDCQLKIELQEDLVQTIFNGNSELFYGFTSATGGAFNAHSVCIQYNVNSLNLNDTSMCMGESVFYDASLITLSPVSPTYQWTVLSGDMSSLNNDDTPTVIASPTVTTTYVVAIEVNDCYNENIQDTVTITIGRPSTPLQVPEFICAPTTFSDLQNAVPNDANNTVSFYSSLLDAQNGTNPLTTISANATKYYLGISHSSGCTYQDSVEIATDISATTPFDFCSNAGQTYQVFFDISGGDPSSIVVEGIAGSIDFTSNPHQFVSDPIPYSTPNWTATIKDASLCDSVVFNESTSCVTPCNGPIANAGTDFTVCYNAPNFQLQGSSTGFSSVVWQAIDPIGGTLNNANQLTADYSPAASDVGNTIRFTLEVMGMTGDLACTDSIDTVAVRIDTRPTGISFPDLICEPLNFSQLQNSVQGDADNTVNFFSTLANAQTLSNPLSSSITGATKYYLGVSHSGGCSYEDSVQIATDLSTSTPTYTCDDVNRTYQVQFEITGGEPSSHVVDDISGTVNSTTTPSVFTSGSISYNNPSWTANVKDGLLCDSVQLTERATCSAICFDPVAFAGNDFSVCYSTAGFQLNGSSMGFSTVEWRAIDPIGGTLNNTNQLIANYVPVDADRGKTIRFVLEVEAMMGNTTCADSVDTVAVQIVSRPTGTATSSEPLICENESVNLDVSPTNSQGVLWSIVQGTGTLSSTTTNTTAYTSSSTDQRVTLGLIIYALAPCMNTMQMIDIDVEQKPSVTLVSTQNSCEGLPATLTTQVQNSSALSWAVLSGNGTISGANNQPDVTYTPAANETSAQLSLSILPLSACTALDTTFDINFIPPTSILSFPDTTTCFNTALEIPLPQYINGTLTSTSWQILQGNGSLASVSAMPQIYTPDNTDQNTTVQLEITITTDNDARCNTAVDTVDIAIETLPDYTINHSAEACLNNTVPIEVINTSTSTLYQWQILQGNGAINHSSTASKQLSYQPNQADVNTTVTLELSSVDNQRAVNCQMNTQQIQFDVFGLPTIQYIYPDTVCEGELVDVKLAINGRYQASSWTLNQGNNAIISTNVDTFIRYQTLASDTTAQIQIQSTVNALAVCNRILTEDITITVVPQAILTPRATQAICEGASIWVGADVEKSSSYNWTLQQGAGTLVPLPNVDSVFYTSHTLDANNAVQITLTALPNNTQCGARVKTLIFGVNPTEIVSANDQTICYGMPFSLNINETQTSYWFSNATKTDTLNKGIRYEGSGLTNDTTTFYVQSAGQCPNTTLAEVKVISIPYPNATMSIAPLPIGIVDETVEFSYKTTNAVTGEWDFGDHSNATFDPIALNTSHDYSINLQGEIPKEFIVTLTLENRLQCESVFTYILPIELISLFFVPNSFTPNENGVNDLFKGKGVNFTEVTLEIFNRWGELIYFGKNEKAQWDGTIEVNGNASPAEIETYIYRFEYRNLIGKYEVKQGFVNLIR